MIKMIRGTFGLPVNGIVVPKDKNSEPFNASEEQEARLVKRGFAVYVDSVEGADDSAPIGFDETPPQGEEHNLDEMGAKELRAYGKELGLSFGVGITKATMIAAIREALAEGADDSEDEEFEDDEEAPEFDASEAVQ